MDKSNWIEPMEPVLRSDVIKGKEWIHQVKWDGIRGLCYVTRGEVRVFTKRGRERTDYYPEITGITAFLREESVILDGEIVSLDQDDKPSFQRMQIRERVADPRKVLHYAKLYPARYIVFDILSLKGKSLTDLPFHERMAYLEKTLIKSENITTTDSYPDGESLLNLMRERNWEGIVSKKINSPYTGGKAHQDWYKTKLNKKLLAVLCGLSMKDSLPNSLVLGVNRGKGLEYIGKASSGLSQEHLKLLKDSLPDLQSDEPAFKSASSELRGVVWLKPLVTLWVSFLEWTRDGSIRHPKILGFSAESPSMANGAEFPDT